jgi:hypothetical protein
LCKSCSACDNCCCNNAESRSARNFSGKFCTCTLGLGREAAVNLRPTWLLWSWWRSWEQQWSLLPLPLLVVSPEMYLVSTVAVHPLLLFRQGCLDAADASLAIGEEDSCSAS